jgi:dCTP deaminase
MKGILNKLNEGEVCVAFWSSQTLEANLNELVVSTTTDAVDCNAITLKVGREIYITPSLEQPAPHSHTKKILTKGEPFAIPPGQFAFVLTEEVVNVPPKAMAFISMKATFKLKGLVNVSGFHVDPGWSGPLIFSVFNAGPSPVHLQRGLPLFLIWYADLDDASERRKTERGPTSIPPQMINNITGAVGSLDALDKRLADAEKRVADDHKKLNDRVHDVEKNQRVIQTLLTILGTLLAGLFVAVVVSFLRPNPSPQIMAPYSPPGVTAPTEKAAPSQPKQVPDKQPPPAAPKDK